MGNHGETSNHQIHLCRRALLMYWCNKPEQGLSTSNALRTAFFYNFRLHLPEVNELFESVFSQMLEIRSVVDTSSIYFHILFYSIH